MPVLKKEELENVRYKSMNDFYYSIDRYDSVADKRKFAVQYLLTYGLSGDPDYSLPEAIHFVRAKLAESTNGKELDTNTWVFLGDPVKYLKAHANIEANKYDADSNLIEDKLLSEHYLNLKNELNNQTENQVLALDTNKNTIDVNMRMAIKSGGKPQLEKIIKDTKPGFFSRLFNTSSKEAKDLNKAYKDFTNTESGYYGNLNMLRDAAQAYLMYKLPDWNPSKPFPSIDDLRRYDKTSTARILFSIKAIESVREEKTIEESFVGLGQAEMFSDANMDIIISEDVPTVSKQPVSEIKKDTDDFTIDTKNFTDNQITNESENEKEL